MKKFFLLLLLSAGAHLIQAVDEPTKCVSHVFVPRLTSTDLVYVDSLNAYRRHHQDKDKSFTYTGTLLYQSSRKSKHLGAAFLLGTSNTVTVAQNAPANINSAFLDLTNSQTPFSGTFTINPQRKAFGYMANWYFNLDSWWCGLWADFTTAILNVRHTLNCEETANVFGNEVPGIRTISDALSNPSYRFGSFFCGLCDDEKRRTGFDDAMLRIGYNTRWCENDLLGIYLIGTLPAGRKPTAQYVFEPLVGSRHGSVGVGFIGEYNMGWWCGCDEDSNFAILSDFNYRFVFSAHECRTFDLFPNGPFSRFLQLAFESDPSTPIPGVNVLTRKIKIEPRGTIQWWLALNYEYCNWDFEVGYNLFWRQKERLKVEAIAPFEPAVGIFDFGCDEVCTSASTTTIGTFAIVSDQSFVALNPTNVNASSALAGRALTNKVYVAVAADGCWCDCVNWFVGVGASYELVSNHDRCSALSYWGAFGKGGLSF